LSWIRKHWEKRFIARAESNLRELVSLVFVLLNGVLSSSPKMAEYREKSADSEDEERPVQDTHCGSNHVPRHMSLAAIYHIEEEMETGDDDEDAQTVEQEYQAYITGALSAKTVDVLKYWEVSSDIVLSFFFIYTDRAPQTNCSTYPTIFAIAMDYLPIQASAVPCERVFSSSAETDTKRRNRISPLMMEALQMLKFQLRKERLNFTAGWTTSEKQMAEDDPDEDLLQNLLRANFQDNFDSIIQTINKHED
jgi:hypothetical protein